MSELIAHLQLCGVLEYSALSPTISMNKHDHNRCPVLKFICVNPLGISAATQ